MEAPEARPRAGVYGALNLFRALTAFNSSPIPYSATATPYHTKTKDFNALTPDTATQYDFNRRRYSDGDRPQKRGTRLLRTRFDSSVQMVVISHFHNKHPAICSHINPRASELLLSIPAAKRTPAVYNDTHAHTAIPAPTPQSPNTPAAPIHSTSASPSVVPRHEHAPPLRPPSPETRARELQLEATDADSITIGKALMDSKEYSRAVHWLKECNSSKATFLRVYSMFLVSYPSGVLLPPFDDSQI